MSNDVVLIIFSYYINFNEMLISVLLYLIFSNTYISVFHFIYYNLLKKYH